MMVVVEVVESRQGVRQISRRARGIPGRSKMMANGWWWWRCHPGDRRMTRGRHREGHGEDGEQGQGQGGNKSDADSR